MRFSRATKEDHRLLVGRADRLVSPRRCVGFSQRLPFGVIRFACGDEALENGNGLFCASDPQPSTAHGQTQRARQFGSTGDILRGLTEQAREFVQWRTVESIVPGLRRGLEAKEEEQHPQDETAPSRESGADKGQNGGALVGELEGGAELAGVGDRHLLEPRRGGAVGVLEGLRGVSALARFCVSPASEIKKKPSRD